MNNILKTDKKSDWVCFLPFYGEFGWYLMTHIKRVYAFEHENKIACIKPGHECLFPNVKKFFYDWQDIKDIKKAGVVEGLKNTNIENNIKKHFNIDDINFIKHTDLGWAEKESLAKISFIPENKINHNLQTDIIVTPRFRMMDRNRNFDTDHWQEIVDILVSNGLSVSLCGAKETSRNLNNLKYKSYDYIDVDTDVELIKSSKLVVTQDSGLLYLTFLCEKPALVTDNYSWGNIDNHRVNKTVFFKEQSLNERTPSMIAESVLNYIKNI